MSPEANQGANPAAAARAAAFDREAFREALLARTMNQTTSARAAIMPTNEALVQTPRETSRPMTDRYPVCRRWPSTAPLLLSQILHALACSPTLSIPVGKRPDASGPTPRPHSDPDDPTR